VDCIHDARNEGIASKDGDLEQIKKLQSWAQARPQAL
jgi:hypothetical protein